jgi:hypothetical protein
MNRKMSFDEACRRYVHRFTMEHVPAWTRKPRPDGTYYAPHYRSDAEWYERTAFPGEPGNPGFPRNSCFSTDQTWPVGQSLDRPFTKDDSR